MTMRSHECNSCAAIVREAGLAAHPAATQEKYGPGASDTEIKIGNIIPYSGPAAGYGEIGKTEAAYFNKVNDGGGVNGRKIVFVSYDDGYSAPKAVEQARKLVESDEVLLIFNSLGTPSNIAIHNYMNTMKVPHLFVASGAAKWNDPKNFPWTMGYLPTFQSEARIYAQHLLQRHPQGKIGILYQNDDYGRDYVKGLKDGLGGKMQIVAELPYDVSDPAVDSQIVDLKAAGADILFDVTTTKFTAQAIRKAAEIGWKPVHILITGSTSVGTALKPAGLANAAGILSATYGKDPTDPKWRNDPDFKEWLAFMDEYYPDGDKSSGFTVYGYAVARVLVRVLEQCGNDLTRENVMRQAANLNDLDVGMLLPGITINTSPTDYAPIKQMQMMRFSGEAWELVGPVIKMTPAEREQRTYDRQAEPRPA
jgi:branched-chain amino acid transport system substrate-binding protein